MPKKTNNPTCPHCHTPIAINHKEDTKCPVCNYIITAPKDVDDAYRGENCQPLHEPSVDGDGGGGQVDLINEIHVLTSLLAKTLKTSSGYTIVPLNPVYVPYELVYDLSRADQESDVIIGIFTFSLGLFVQEWASRGNFTQAAGLYFLFTLILAGIAVYTFRKSSQIKKRVEDCKNNPQLQISVIPVTKQ